LLLDLRKVLLLVVASTPSKDLLLGKPLVVKRLLGVAVAPCLPVVKETMEGGGGSLVSEVCASSCSCWPREGC